MKKTKQIISAVSAAVLAGSLLTGCIGQTSQPVDLQALEGTETSENAASETEPEEPEETDAPEDEASESSGSGEELVELSKMEMKEAQKTLEKFFKGMQNNDADAILKYSNMQDALMLFDGQEYTEDEIRERVEELFDSVSSFEVVEGTSKAADLVRYNETVADLLKNAEEELAVLEAEAGEAEDETDEEYRRQIEMVQEMLKPIDGLAVFTVSIKSKTDEDDEDAVPEITDENIYVMRVDGKWLVDIVLAETLIAEAEEDDEMDYGSISANVAAKSTYNAANSALTDMDTIDCDIRKLDGSFTCSGKEFAEAETVKKNDKRQFTEDELKQELKATMRMYFGDISELDTVSLWLNQGVCTAVAILTEDGSIGYYPLQAGGEDEEEPETLDDALDAAKENAVG